jgi:uncharacterized membrane protein YecN with MAPEG domain
MITSLFAGILGLIYAKLSLDTIAARRAHKISIGVGPNNEIASIVSAHSNFSSYSIYLLFLMYLCESSNAVPTIAIYILGSAFTLGRLLHYSAFKSQKMNFRRRVLGMQLTLWPLIILSLINIWIFIW